MCGLFGFYKYGNNKYDLSELTNSLACESSIRGIDATGIAYNQKKKLVIHKEAKAAMEMDFKMPKDVTCMMGHTRHSTQGDKKKNYNNHPFLGICDKTRFALAHNGVLINEKRIAEKFKLPKTKIETDSYLAVQMLQKEKELDAHNIKSMAENVDGSFSFSILDERDSLWLVKGDSPLSVVHFPESNIYVYASTDSILYRALADTELLKEVKSGSMTEIKIESGEFLKFEPDGKIIRNEFDYTNYSFYPKTSWWHYGIDIGSKKKNDSYDEEYLKELKTMASYYGYSEKDIDTLLNDGFTYDDIEELIYYY